MKITQDTQKHFDIQKHNQMAKGRQSNSFANSIQNETAKLREGELSRLLQEITSQGEKIAKFRSLRDVGRYKSLVKQFVQEAVKQGLDLKQSRGWNFQGENRQYTLIETVDKELVELTDMVLNKENNSVDILHKIGEIKGMLINLYA
ncbi:YaaR family protein [Salirhabdus salicampi]|uniref:YaaR family protein n=1 Tax=Salirhabdus salicampi TaxID=476102 RepID=UPI0020C37072|nr:YaaR family protein [Salirhabdus salicampi]MCP8618153.1 YaaR family protein [Salirhabdus salicampi]